MVRILVVEDEPNLALGLQDDLKLGGYEVEVVRDGEAASRRAREQVFDLIILDVMLPRKDGFEVCRELREAGLCIPVILLTAKTQESDKVLGLDLGANDYITKPFSPRDHCWFALGRSSQLACGWIPGRRRLASSQPCLWFGRV